VESNFEKDLTKVLNEEKEMPAVVREALDNTYRSIRSQSRNGWKVFMKRGIVAACCLMIVGTIFTNKSVMADIKALFNFKDKAIDMAVNEGFTQQGTSFAADKNVKVALESYFWDSNKIGLSFKLKLNDAKLQDGDMDSIKLSYRIKNGDGKYLFDSDGKNDTISNSMRPKPVFDQAIQLLLG
jgi:cell division septal protein FtsQ